MNFLNKIKLLILSHKVISVIVLAVLFTGGYYWFSSSSAPTQTTYILGEVKKGNIISSVDGTGQVAALNQVDIKSEVSGDITWLGVSAGQQVRAGQAIATIDNTDALQSISNAETSLSEAKLQFDRDSAQAPIDYQKQLETLASDQKDLEKTYDDVFNSISNTFLDLPTVMTGVEDVLYGNQLSIYSNNQENINVYRDLFGNDDVDGKLVNSLADIADKDYRTALDSYDKNFADFKNITRYSDKAVLENLLTETLTTTKAVAQAIKSENNLLDTIVDIAQNKKQKLNSAISIFQSNLKSYIGTTNNDLSSLLSQQSSLDNGKQAIINDQRNIDLLLINNPTGNNPISLQVSKNSIAKQESDLATLKSDLAKYTVRAPFDGTIAKVSVQKLDSVSNGTVIATIVTNQQLAEISLNEVDVANVKLGQKVTLTFDAVEGLTISGKVSEVDTVGTVSQGVVNYSVKILFDTQDSRIKPGMSVSASIITDIKSDILVIPASAVKTSQGISYVDVPDSSEIPAQISNSGIVLQKPIVKQQVETGTTNGTSIEITGGLNEGDKIIIRTSGGSTTSSTQSSSQGSNRSSIRIPGMGF